MPPILPGSRCENYGYILDFYTRHLLRQRRRRKGEEDAKELQNAIESEEKISKMGIINFEKRPTDSKEMQEGLWEL